MSKQFKVAPGAATLWKTGTVVSLHTRECEQWQTLNEGFPAEMAEAGCEAYIDDSGTIQLLNSDEVEELA